MLHKRQHQGWQRQTRLLLVWTCVCACGRISHCSSDRACCDGRGAQAANDNVVVAVRCRPLSSGEKAQGCRTCVVIDPRSGSIE